MDTILYLYPVRKKEVNERKIFRPRWRRTVTVSRTEYFFPDYRLVKAAVTGCDKCDGRAGMYMEQSLRKQLQELTEDPDHTYVVCREPLSFYFGREFREYRQQNWVEHLLKYGENEEGYPLWPDLILLGRNPFLPYLLIRYAVRLRSVKWYLTGWEYREDEDWLAEELEEEYGLVPEIHLLNTEEDYGKLRLQEEPPGLVLDFCDGGRVHGGRLAKGSIWLDFSASEETENRVRGQCPQIRYFSMKKEWKDPRKALEYLDIISKNGYNNPVD